MLQNHMDVFFAAADQCSCWIGVREPNSLAEKWIGKPGYIPKGLNCKAKTSDNSSFAWAGLVVDPTARAEAFTKGTLIEATNTWKNKVPKPQHLPPGFTCVQVGPERGLVKFGGSAIFADYDLMAISRSNSRGEMLFTDRAQQDALFGRVEPLVNKALGVPMIQHGPEFAYEAGVGAREFEWVFWFGPGRKFKRGPSSMPQGDGQRH